MDDLKKNKIKIEEEEKEEKDTQNNQDFKINTTSSNTNTNATTKSNNTINFNNDIRKPLLNSQLQSQWQFQPIDSSFQFKTISSQNNNISNDLKKNTIIQQSLQSKRSQSLIEAPVFSIDQLNINIKEKLIKKKEKTKCLKQEIASLNEKLLNNTQSQTKLLSRIKELELEKTTFEHQINELTITKSKEIQTMNETIKQFELIISENSSSNLNGINELRTQLDSYRSKLDDCNAYIKEIILFLNRMNKLMNSKSIKEITDIVDLKNKITEIENYILLSNSNCVSYKEKYDKLMEINAKLIEGKGSVDDCYDFDELNSKRVPNSNSNSKLKVPQFQNKFLEGLSHISSNINNDFDEDITTSNIDICNSNNNRFKNKKDTGNRDMTYKTLENRVNALERELNAKIKIANYNNDTFTMLTPKNKIDRSYSSNKISKSTHSKQLSSQYQYQQCNHFKKMAFQDKDINNSNNDYEHDSNKSISTIDHTSNKKKIKKVKTAKNKQTNLPKQNIKLKK